MLSTSLGVHAQGELTVVCVYVLISVLTITFLQYSDTMSGQYVICTAAAKFDPSIKNFKCLQINFF